MKQNKKKFKETVAEMSPTKGIYELAGMLDSGYSESTLEKYEETIRNMGLTDIQNHAIKIGLVPIQDREKLIQRLIKEYNRKRSIISARNTVVLSSPQKVNNSIPKLLKGAR